MAANPEQGAGTLEAAAKAIEEKMFAEPEESGEETEVEAEAETTEETAETEAEIEPEAEAQPSVETLEQVAEALGVPMEDFLKSLRHRVKVNGESLEVTLDELQAGYQKNSDYREKTNALKRDRETFDVQRAEALKKLEADHHQNAYILNSIEQSILQSVQSDEMEKLKATNRNEWLSRRLEFQDRLQGIQKLKAEAGQRYQSLQQQSSEEQKAKLAQLVEREREALSSAIPDWSEPTRTALNDYLGTSFGFKPEEIAGVYDHRLVVMAHKAMLYDQSLKNTEATVKKVKLAPKIVKPSPTQGRQKIAQQELQKLRGRLKQSGSVKDAAELILKSGIIRSK